MAGKWRTWRTVWVTSLFGVVLGGLTLGLGLNPVQCAEWSPVHSETLFHFLIYATMPGWYVAFLVFFIPGLFVGQALAYGLAGLLLHWTVVKWLGLNSRPPQPQGGFRLKTDVQREEDKGT